MNAEDPGFAVPRDGADASRLEAATSEGSDKGDNADGDSADNAELAAELERISTLPVSERAAEYARLHQQLGQLLESTPVQLFDGESA